MFKLHASIHTIFLTFPIIAHHLSCVCPDTG